MSYKSNNILELFSSEIHSLDTPGRSRPLDATLCNYPLGKVGSTRKNQAACRVYCNTKSAWCCRVYSARVLQTFHLLLR